MSEVTKVLSIDDIYDYAQAGDIDLPDSLDPADCKVALEAIADSRVNEVAGLARQVLGDKLSEQHERVAAMRQELESLLSDMAIADAVANGSHFERVDRKDIPPSCMHIKGFSLGSLQRHSVRDALIREENSIKGISWLTMCHILGSPDLPKEYFQRIEGKGINFLGTTEEPDFTRLAANLCLAGVGPGRLARVFDLFARLGDDQRESGAPTQLVDDKP